MVTIKKFEDLEIWQMAKAFANAVFETYTNTISFNKNYELKGQLNASGGSVMDNIAEGFGRGGRNEFVNFLSIAKRSAEEAKSQLYRAPDRKYITQEKSDSLYDQAEQICEKIGALIKYLNSSTDEGSKYKDRTVIKN
jgi:four helix bundle protein